MKTKMLIFLVFFWANIGYLFAQDDVYGTPQKNRSNKINTGFVFIDGKYIEPPYKIKLKNDDIYLNDNLIYKFLETKKIKVNKLPQYPKSINKNSTIDDVLNIIHPDYGIPYINIAEEYFENKYKENEIIKRKLINYIKRFPNVRDYNGIRLETYNGEVRNFFLVIKNQPKKKEFKKVEKGLVESFNLFLKQNKVLIFLPGRNNYKIKPADFIYTILKLHNDNNFTQDQIINYLIKNKIVNSRENVWLNNFLKKLNYKLNFSNKENNSSKRKEYLNNNTEYYNSDKKEPTAAFYLNSQIKK